MQAIVVMGAAQYDGTPSPDLVSRLQDADDLWGRHMATTVVVTGSKEKGDKFTEAEASASWLEQHGVPPADVIEVGGDDSWTNLSDAAAALHQRGMTKVLIVTDGFHEDRSLAIASNVGLQAWPAPDHQLPDQGMGHCPVLRQGDGGGGPGPDHRVLAPPPAGLACEVTHSGVV